MKWLTLRSRVVSSRTRIRMNASVKKRKKKTRDPSPGEKRVTGRLARSLFFVIILGAVFFGAWWALARSSYFNVRAIEVAGNHLYQPKEIIAMAGLEPGENIFSLDLSRYRSRLLQEVNIRNAAVERHFPDTIRIKVFEREPRARVKFGRYYTIDAWGVVLRERKEKAGDDLPVISGLRVQNGRLYPEEEKERCLSLLKELDQMGLSGAVDIREIRVADSESIVLETGQGLEIKLGKEEYHQQLNRLMAVLNHLQKSPSRARTVDLRFSHVPVTFED